MPRKLESGEANAAVSVIEAAIQKQVEHKVKAPSMKGKPSQHLAGMQSNDCSQYLRTSTFAIKQFSHTSIKGSNKQGILIIGELVSGPGQLLQK